MTDLAEILATLTAERYAPSPWWDRPPLPPEVLDDSPTRTAARRAAMAADFDTDRKAAS